MKASRLHVLPTSGRHTVFTVGLLLVWAAFLAAGCSRGFYRRQADTDAYSLVQQAAHDTRWSMQDYSIDVDPRSRMFDPFCPDHEPMPPDDPRSHRLMQCVDCKHGFPYWHEDGETAATQNPSWRTFLPLDENGQLVLGADDAMRMALLQSRAYQRELENLYLSALDVSFERFRFDAQFFGGYEAQYTADGRARSSPGGSSSSLFGIGLFPATRGIRLEKMYANGGELVVGLANSLLWQFAGPDDHSATTLLDFALVQPLLRGASRARVLERLTISERALLANVRQMERFRRGFYLEIVTGRDAGPGPSRRGGIFGGSGLEGFSGVGGGGFGRLGGGGGGGRGGTGAAQAGGYLGLLQEQQNIRNQEANVAALRSSLAQLDAFFEAGRIDFFQVELARQALFNAQSRLLSSRAAYQNTLDRYKMTLGLPPQLNLRIEDPMLDDFRLIDSEIVPIQNRLTDAQSDVGRIIIEMLPDEPEAPRAAAGPDDPPGDELEADDSGQLALRLSKLKQAVARIEALRQHVLDVNVPRAHDDIQRLRDSLGQRVAELKGLKERLLGEEEDTPARAGAAGRRLAEEIDPQVIDTTRVLQMPGKLDESLASFVGRFQKHQAALSQFQDELDRAVKTLQQGGRLSQEELTGLLVPIPNQLSEISADVLELTLVQARARTESVVLPPIELGADDALEIARHHRRDWMNARASLVDSWRLIEFNADDLESSLDVIFAGDISNTGDNPIRLSDTTGRLRVGLQFDAPLTRLSERNTYRQALIEYQQARRSYYALEDAIAQGLRDTLRTIELNQLNFELRRAAIHVAVGQVELARLRLQEPPKPNEDKMFGATTARDLVTALSELLSVQNDFLSVWVNYEVLRRGLDMDLGTMRIDAEGIWVDPGPIDEGFLQAVSEPCRGCEPDRLPPSAALSVELLPPERVSPAAGKTTEKRAKRPSKRDDALTKLGKLIQTGVADSVPDKATPVRLPAAERRGEVARRLRR